MLATHLPCLKRLLPEGASVHFERLLGHEAEAKRLGGIEAFPKGVLHLENDITYATVARIAFFDVHDVGRLGLGVLLVEAEGSILAPSGVVFGNNQNLLVGRTIVLEGAGRVDTNGKAGAVQGVLLAVEHEFVFGKVDVAFVGVEAGVGAIHLAGDDALGRLVELGLTVGVDSLLVGGGGVETGVEGGSSAGSQGQDEGENEMGGFHSNYC